MSRALTAAAIIAGLFAIPYALPTAAEEDHFPTCHAIGTPAEMGCDVNDTPAQCASYLGEGY